MPGGSAYTLHPMYRLIACDIDGTILGSDGSLSDANRDALRQLHNRGIVVVLASGRATVSIRTVLERILPSFDHAYLISFNGARVVNTANGAVVFEQGVDRESLRRVVSFAREHELVLQGYANDAFLSEPRGEPADEYSRVYAKETAMEWIKVPDLAAALPGGSPKLLLIGDPDALSHHERAIESMGSGRIATTYSKPHFLEILNDRVNKGAGLVHLAKHLGIPLEDTVAVGDAQNDIEMIQSAGLGIAVANAVGPLKEVADVILDRSVDEGSIAEVVDRFFS